MSLDKEKLAKTYCEKQFSYRPVEITSEYKDYSNGLIEAETYYKQLLEEKDATICRIQERRKEIQEEAEKLKQQLSQAKELLQNLSWYLSSIFAQHDFDGLNNHNNKIQEFLNQNK